MEVNWYKRATRTLTFENFDVREPTTWVSRAENKPCTALVDYEGGEKIFVALQGCVGPYTTGASGILHITLDDEDFIVDEEHSVKMDFPLRIKLRPDMTNQGLLGSAIVPTKYRFDLKNQFQERERDNLLSLRIEIEDSPPLPAVERRKKRKQWK